jgi:hypothetical protein
MNTTKISLILIILVSALMGCKKRDGSAQTATIQISVLYPSSYSQTNVTNTQVKLVSKTDGSTFTALTNNSGLATLNDVVPGTYTITVNKNLSADEAATLTGVAQSIQLNATENDVIVNASTSLTLKLSGSPAGSLLIKEVYYSGSKTASGGTYFSDQFVELYNNSTEVIYLDGLCIADLYGNSGLINPNSPATPYQGDKDNAYASNVWRIPGSGKQHPLSPGQSVVIAQDGVNHKEASLNPNSPVDLSQADWETFNERADNRDADAPNVPNLEKLYFTGGFDWLLTVFGPAVVIFRTDDFEKLEKVAIPGSTLDPRIKIPNTIIIDAFEALKDAGSAGYKRVPVALDAGFVYLSDTYTSESFRRKIATTINGRIVLQDTNNSGNDFIKLSKPTPKKFD